MLKRKSMTTLRLTAMAFLFSFSSIFAAEYKPAIEYSSLLNMRFYEDSGSFMADKLQMVFPPAEAKAISFVILDEENRIIKKVDLKIEKWDEFKTFDGLQPVGPGVVTLEEPGSYTLAFLVDGQLITSKPFTLKVKESGDPYNPTKTFYREGYWPNVGYLSVPTEEPEAPLMFTWWTSLREVPGGEKRAKCTVHLMQNGKEIAASPSAVIISSNTWDSFTRRLVQPREAGGKNLMLSMLTGNDGDYSIVVRMNGKPVKSYAVKVRSGAIQPLPFNSLDYEPHNSFISPRMIDTSSRSGSSYKMLNAYWLVRE